MFPKDNENVWCTVSCLKNWNIADHCADPSIGVNNFLISLQCFYTLLLYETNLQIKRCKFPTDKTKDMGIEPLPYEIMVH
jgi:hypothetical protein